MYSSVIDIPSNSTSVAHLSGPLNQRLNEVFKSCSIFSTVVFDMFQEFGEESQNQKDSNTSINQFKHGKPTIFRKASELYQKEKNDFNELFMELDDDTILLPKVCPQKRKRVQSI
jgi:hypothetical protein